MLTRLRSYASILIQKYSIHKTLTPPFELKRPMKFPYTYSAKIAQFPYKFYRENNWIYKYYVYGIITSLPVFIYIHNLANSPGNKEAWAAIRAKEAQEHHH